jgi:hypothetical protein
MSTAGRLAAATLLLLAGPLSAGTPDSAVAGADGAARSSTDGVPASSGADPALPAPANFVATLLAELHPALGLGATLRTRTVTGKLVPVSIAWRDNRYEFFAAYFRDQEFSGLTYQGYPAHIGLAPPLRAYSLSRRFNVLDRRHLKLFAGVGAAYLDTRPCATLDEAHDRTPRLDYNERVYRGCDKLNGSRLNFALQLGIRVYNHDESAGFEFAYRHISNAGMTSGNEGEDFVTAMLVF